MKKFTPLQPGKTYKIENVGINNTTIFFTKNNFRYFLSLAEKYIHSYGNIVAWFLDSTQITLIIEFYDAKKIYKEAFYKGDLSPSMKRIPRHIIKKDEYTASKIISNQLRKIFLRYAMGINRQERRIGSLFLKNFRRIKAKSSADVKSLIIQTHLKALNTASKSYSSSLGLIQQCFLNKKHHSAQVHFSTYSDFYQHHDQIFKMKDWKDKLIL